VSQRAEATPTTVAAELTADDLIARWPGVRPFLLVGAASIVAGGVVAAVSRPSDFGNGPWLAAYLVLVVGMAQIALGGGQAWLAAAVPPTSLVRRELLAWNVGAVGVVVGTLTAVPVVTTVGGALSVAALVLFLGGVRQTGAVPAWARMTYRGIVTFVLLSIPVGLFMAWTRHA
jgi:hypothetical protein